MNWPPLKLRPCEDPWLQRGASRLSVLLWIAFGLTVLHAATQFDVRIAVCVHEHAPLNKSGWLAWLMRRPGHGTFPAAAALVILLWLRNGPAAALCALASAFSSVNWLLKWLVGRSRPFRLELPPDGAAFYFEPLKGGIRGLLGQVNLSFPSGDASVAFATAAALAIAFPRWWFIFFALAAITAVERVLENAHYASDVVGGAILGIAVAHIAAWIIRRCHARLQQSSPSTVLHTEHD